MGFNKVDGSTVTRQTAKTQSKEKMGQAILDALEKGTGDLVVQGLGVVIIGWKKFSFELREVEPISGARYYFDQWTKEPVIVVDRRPLPSLEIARFKNGKLECTPEYELYADDEKVLRAIAEAKHARAPRAEREMFHPTSDHFSGNP